jgi:hypothetical protein
MASKDRVVASDQTRCFSVAGQPLDEFAESCVPGHQAFERVSARVNRPKRQALASAVSSNQKLELPAGRNVSGQYRHYVVRELRERVHGPLRRLRAAPKKIR